MLRQWCLVGIRCVRHTPAQIFHTLFWHERSLTKQWQVGATANHEKASERVWESDMWDSGLYCSLLFGLFNLCLTCLIVWRVKYTDLVIKYIENAVWVQKYTKQKWADMIVLSFILYFREIRLVSLIDVWMCVLAAAVENNIAQLTLWNAFTRDSSLQ